MKDMEPTSVLYDLIEMFSHEIAQCSLVRPTHAVRKHHRCVHYFTVYQLSSDSRTSNVSTGDTGTNLVVNRFICLPIY